MIFQFSSHRMDADYSDKSLFCGLIRCRFTKDKVRGFCRRRMKTLPLIILILQMSYHLVSTGLLQYRRIIHVTFLMCSLDCIAPIVQAITYEV